MTDPGDDRRPIRRHRKGYFEVRLPPTDREFLRTLAREMRELVSQ